MPEKREGYLSMDIKDAIFFRRSVRRYRSEAVGTEELDGIKNFFDGIKPLYHDIRLKYAVLARSDVRCILPWLPPQEMTIAAEYKKGAHVNAGFVFQQMELYMQSAGLGTCWLGMAHPKEKRTDGLVPVIVLAFGHPAGEIKRASVSEFKRKKLSDIADREDARLEPARLAPSSVNSQPWYFIHDGEYTDMYIKKKLLNAGHLREMNMVDAGIALAHMYAANKDAFSFSYREGKELKGYEYTGSFTL